VGALCLSRLFEIMVKSSDKCSKMTPFLCTGVTKTNTKTITILFTRTIIFTFKKNEIRIKAS